MQRAAWILIMLTGGAGVAQARPVEDGTRITLFAGARYVPHKHFENLAAESGTPVESALAVGPELMASFSYAPATSIEISLEVGYAYDRYTFDTGPLALHNLPLAATLRWMPWATRFCPYVGAGIGYMLGFVSGAPSGETETHAQELHALVGFNFELSRAVLLVVEDRYQIASGDIVPIGQVQTGGNALMLGISFVLDPAKSLAPH